MGVLGVFAIALALLAVSAPVGAEQAPFITIWDTTKPGDGDRTITIPTSGSDYHYFVRWEDVTDPTITGETGPFTGDATIEFPSPGVYKVMISGDFPRIDFSSPVFFDHEKLLSIEQWGDIEWKSMEYAFAGAVNLTYNATDAPDLSDVTNMSYMFAGATAFDGDLRDWDVRNVTHMVGTFAFATSFNGDVSTWDVGNVTNMAWMFARATSFNGNLSGWDVGQVTNMTFMFADARSFNGDLSAWNVGNVTSMASMFADATSFNGDISAWDVRNVADMSRMFKGATAFNRSLGGWEILNVQNMSEMLDGSGLSRANYDATLIGWSSLRDLYFNVTLGAEGLVYCTASDARKTLIEEYRWNIVGDSKDCPALQFLITVSDPNPEVGTDVTVTVQLTDENGDPVRERDRELVWSSNDGIFDPVVAWTDDDGVATLTFTVSTLAGVTHVVTVTDGEGNEGVSPPITTVAGPPAEFEVSVNEANPVAGTSVIVTARLVDSWGNRVPWNGLEVTWTSTGGGDFNAPVSTTDENGTATVQFTVSVEPGTSHRITATAMIDGDVIAGESPEVTTKEGPARYEVIVSDTNPVAGSEIQVTAQLVDGKGDAVFEGGRQVVWSSTNGGSFDRPVSETDENGIATVTFRVSTVAGRTHVLTATDQGNPAVQGESLPIVTRAGDPARFVVTVSNETPFAGGAVEITAQLADEHGNAVRQAGHEVYWSSTGGGTFSVDVSTTDDNGIARVTFTVSTVAGTEHVVTATNEDASIQGQSPEITTRPGLPAQYLVTASDANPVAGTQVTVTAQLADEWGNPFPASGISVEWSSTNGGVFAEVRSQTDDNGAATVTFTVSVEPETVHVVTAKTDLGLFALQGETQIATQAGPTQLLIEVDDENPVAGAEVTVTAQLLDAKGQPFHESGRRIVWSSTGGGSFRADETETDENGRATVTFTVSTVAGTTHIVRATDDDEPDITGESPEITVQAGEAARYSVYVSNTTPAAGTSVTVTVQLADSYGNAVQASGITVTWSSTNGGAFDKDETETDEDGRATVTFTPSTVAGTTHVVRATSTIDVAEVGADAPTLLDTLTYFDAAADSGTIVIEGESPPITTVAGDPAQFLVEVSELHPVAGTSVTVTAQLADAFGNAVAQDGRQVVWSSTNGGVFDEDVTETDEDGRATVTFTVSTMAGTTHVVTATDEDAPDITGESPEMTSQSGDAAMYLVQVSNTAPFPNESVVVTAQLADVHGNPVSLGGRQVVWWSTNGGSFGAETSETGPDGVATVVFTVSSEPGTKHVVKATDEFGVSGDSPVIEVQDPLWPALEILKSAETNPVDVGDVVLLRVEVTNRDDVPVPATSRETYVVDRLPEGFVYLEGSARINGAAASDPDIDGLTLTWRLGDVAPGTTVRIEYAVAVSAAAIHSNGRSAAFAGGLSQAGLPYVTDPVEFQLVVRKGLFGPDGMIVGTVFVDLNGNGVRDPGEPGVAGARIVTGDGVETTADERGLFSLRGLYPGVHVLKLVSAGNAGSSAGGEAAGGTTGAGTTTRLVRVPVSGVTLVDFAVAPTGPGVVEGSGASVDVTVGLIDMLFPLRTETDSSWQVNGALFTQRTLPSGNVLTVRYTSRPSLPIEPAAFPDWIETGDESRTEDRAPSSGGWYMKVEGENGTLLYGDYATPGLENRYMPFSGRSQGWLARLTQGNWNLELFTSSNRGGERQVEIPAEGRTGPYDLDGAPILSGSESVWLIQVDDGVEVARRKLTASVDYILDPQRGTLWLSRPIESFNPDGTRNVLLVQYRVAGDAASDGMQAGLRLSAGEQSGLPIAVTWQTGTTDGLRLTTLGVDGRLPLGDASYLAFEAATQRGEGASAEESGTAARVDVQWLLGERVRLSGFAVYAGGTVRTFGSATLPTGLRGEGKVEVPIGTFGTVAYVHGFRTGAGATNRHEESVIFSVDVAPFRHRLELRSLRESGSPRSLSLQAGTEWTISDRQQFSMSGIVNLGGGGTSSLILPATAWYRMTLGETAELRLAYQAAEVSPSGGAEWSASVGSTHGPNVYGGYRSGVKGEVFMGLQHAWNAAADLYVGGSMEHRTSPGSADASRTTISWFITYTGLRGHEVGLKNEFVVSSLSVKHTWTLSAHGEVAPGWRYALDGRWHDPLELTTKPDLVRALRGSIAYRDLQASRHAFVMQALDHLYRRVTDAGDEEARRVSILAADWAHRFRNGVTVTTKIALYQTVRDWRYEAGDVASYRTHAVLYQLSGQVPLADTVTAEVFARRIVDSLGTQANGVAVELMKDLTENFALGVGYSTLGENDPDLQLVLPEWKEGVYIRLVAKF